MTRLWTCESSSTRGQRQPPCVSKRRVLRTYFLLRRLAILRSGFRQRKGIFVQRSESARAATGKVQHFDLIRPTITRNTLGRQLRFILVLLLYGPPREGVVIRRRDASSGPCEVFTPDISIRLKSIRRSMLAPPSILSVDGLGKHRTILQ